MSSWFLDHVLNGRQCHGRCHEINRGIKNLKTTRFPAVPLWKYEGCISQYIGWHVNPTLPGNEPPRCQTTTRVEEQLPDQRRRVETLFDRHWTLPPSNLDYQVIIRWPVPS